MTTTARAIVIELPLPPRALSSNGSHGHWSKKNRAAQDYRLECKILALMDCRVRLLDRRRMRVSYAFGIKGARKTGVYCPRDIPNALAAFKAGQDALVDAGVLVDDSAKWMELGTVTIDPKVGPFVRVTVEPCDS